MTAQNLDPGTLMFATAVLGFLTAGFSFTTVKALSGTGKGVEEWGWAMMTLGGAFLLWFLTPATSALFFIGNVLVVLTGLFLLRAFFQLTGEPFTGELLDVGKHVRPNWSGGRIVLFVEPPAPGAIPRAARIKS